MAAPNIVSVASILGTTQVGDLSTTLTTTLVTAASDKVLKINIIRVTNVTDNDATAPQLSTNESLPSNSPNPLGVH